MSEGERGSPEQFEKQEMDQKFIDITELLKSGRHPWR